ncbi:MAG TPA: pilus assembly protein TadG-related protein [Mycobacteriales bacterium]|jgi:Flp pilus assembly protein TadG|nr:pilus assembly protein TadG-related protein [Mycobacteriales bacterium]
MRRHLERTDEGAYAILYGLLLVAVIGMAAIVVDLGALRQNRRQTRLAADSAAVAGAMSLDPFLTGGAKPREACEKAWGYLATNLGFTVPAATGCTSLPAAWDPTTACPLATPPAVGTVGAYTVTVTWPIPDSSVLLTAPNAQPAVSSTTVQSVDPDVDGNEPCLRMAVGVAQVQQASFATIFGVRSNATGVTSVARAAKEAGPGAPIAALNVLNRTDCQTLRTSSQGFIRVASVTDPDPAIGTRPGIIAVESSGAGCGGGRRVIDVGPNAATSIRADGATGPGTGIILSWALNASPTGNPTYAYSSVGARLAPTPTVLGERSGATPVTNVYGCATGCSVPYVANLRAAYAGTSIPTGGYAPSPLSYGSQAFVRLSGGECNVNSLVVKTPANYYFDCASLDIKAPLIIQGGNVVTRGGINVQAGGCFAMNVLAATCPTVDATTGEITQALAPTEGILFVQQGDLFRRDGSIFTPHTAVFLDDGHIDFGGNAGTVFMSNPRLDPAPADCNDACQDARFWKVAVWSEKTGTNSITGQGSLFLRGVLFTPNATFDYGGQAAQEQQGAQFWADKIQNSGQGNLVMAPDPSDSVPTPLLRVRLIR